jgi:hypothetical protein
MTTLLVLLAVWVVLSPVLALACGAFIRAGKGGPLPETGLRLLPGLGDGGIAEGDPRSGAVPHEDRAA